MREVRRWGGRLLALVCAGAVAACGLPQGASSPLGGELGRVKVQGRSVPFMWGVSTAGYQYEGHETTSQWAQWDLAGKTEERRKNAADGFNRYAEDMDLARGLGCNTFRTSLEWARIEPEEGRYDPEAIAHYRRMLTAMRARGLTPIVTLMHFVYPAWLDRYGGWESPKAVEAYVRFAELVSREFGDLADWYLTFNEPTVFIGGGYLDGHFPPGRNNDPMGALKVLKNMVSAHVLAYPAIHRNDPVAHVSFNQYTASWQVLGSKRKDAISEESFLEGVLDGADGFKRLDYIAIDYYTRLKFSLPMKIPAAWQWRVHPEGFYEALRHYHRLTGLPVLVAENGFATDDLKPRDDGWTREAYLAAHVEQMQRAAKDGIPVLGYVHWSITDNYEWGSYRPRFGLYSVECRTGDYRRVPTPAAETYRQVIRAGGVTPDIARTVSYPTGYRPLVRP